MTNHPIGSLVCDTFDAVNLRDAMFGNSGSPDRVVVYQSGTTTGKTNTMRNTSIIGRAASAALSAAATAGERASKAITEFGKAMKSARPTKAATKGADPYSPYSPAVICHPLRFIRERTMVKSKDPKTGQTVWDFGPEYHTARHAANRGNGALVKRMARQIAASGN